MTEQEARDLARSFVDLMDRIAGMTPSVVDDRVIGVAAAVVENDTYWAIAWRVIEKAIGYIDKDNQKLIVETDGEVPVLAGQVGVDPVVIITVVQMVIEFLRWWRDR